MIVKQSWDSDFFGFEIGAVNWNNDKPLSQSLQNSQEFRCIYLFSDINISLRELNKLGFRKCLFVDKKILLERKITNIVSDSNHIIKYNIGEDIYELTRIALQSGQYSRFNIDPDFKLWYNKMYSEWIINSINKKIADEVFLFKQDGIIKGIITCKLHKNYGQIGLIATDVKYRKQGIGNMLINATETYYLNNGKNKARIVTQEDNLSAVNLYLKKGYHLKKRQFVYHLWN